MVQRLGALLGRADENLQLLARLGLAHVFLQQLGAQRALQGFFLR
jgi:predicted negative regulator of RcsB-dependent stress response